MITGRDIVIVSSIDWHFLWQVHQEIALRFARNGNRVFYIENTGVRSPRLTDLGRILVRLRNWSRAMRARSAGQPAANVAITSPLTFPPFSLLGRLANPLLLSLQVKRPLKRLGLRNPIIWSYLPTDTALEIIHNLRAPDSVVIYYCVADFSQLTSNKQRLQTFERRLIEESDLIFANSSQVAEHCRKWSDDVHVFPPGVDFRKFVGEDATAATIHPSVENEARKPADSSGQTPSGPTVPSPVASRPEPVIGYVGGLHRFVDYELLVALALARPHWSWVFVGPLHTRINNLEQLPNVIMMGQKSHDELPDLIRGFDVCLVPYLINAATATVAPVKINEYLAAGKPVVSTELPTVCEFNQEHKILALAANNCQAFLAAIEESLQQQNDPKTIARRREVAASSDWENRFRAMNDLIEAKASSARSAS